MTRLIELINAVEWESVKSVLLDSGLEDAEGMDSYIWLFAHLREEKTPLNVDGLVISLTTVIGDDGDPYVNVDGIKMYDSEDMGYALEFKPWEEWLGMEIEPRTLEEFTQEQIVAHCMWEMSFVSFDENKIKATFDRLMSDAEEAKLYYLDNEEEEDDGTDQS